MEILRAEQYCPHFLTRKSFWNQRYYLKSDLPILPQGMLSNFCTSVPLHLVATRSTALPSPIGPPFSTSYPFERYRLATSSL